MIAKGKAFVYGNNVDTDVIIPARYLNNADPSALASHCMEDIDENFAKEVEKGDVILAGKNFGCGSSREHAPLAIKTTGVSCVIAESFSRIFYRNAINIGLPILECEAAVKEAKRGDVLEVDFSGGTIVNKTQQKTYQTKPFPPFIQSIIDQDGLVGKVQKELAAKKG
ncbi:3-isopropylmalate dehydratase small subunit [Tindallia californiensis]|uniref:3-isopropylmalate dehydratase small subunit n=1 Tax=Tindallia californiensis TaxID=159292 RepID=A0A1H3Q8W9_9FIRM|nr:3-isopropylmalate dehydratase small subunit [Tindallia californiensis]SDZ09846.1 3-isopropylmalate/(R)-2-methylmalate dehydratase small subunit [Tindallia californiensis]